MDKVSYEETNAKRMKSNQKEDEHEDERPAPQFQRLQRDNLC